MPSYPKNARLIVIGIKSEILSPGSGQAAACDGVDTVTQDDIPPHAVIALFRSLPRAMHERRYYCYLIESVVMAFDAHDDRWAGYNRQFHDPNPPAHPHPPRMFYPIHNPTGRPYMLPTGEIGSSKYISATDAARVRAWQIRPTKRKMDDIVVVDDSDDEPPSRKKKKPRSNGGPRYLDANTVYV